jgi:hypothetical protein
MDRTGVWPEQRLQKLIVACRGLRLTGGRRAGWLVQSARSLWDGGRGGSLLLPTACLRGHALTSRRLLLLRNEDVGEQCGAMDAKKRVPVIKNLCGCTDPCECLPERCLGAGWSSSTGGYGRGGGLGSGGRRGSGTSLSTDRKKGVMQVRTFYA